MSLISGEKITPQMIHNWRLRDNVPPDFAPFIEQITEGLVLADEVCPKVPWHVIRGNSEAA